MGTEANMQMIIPRITAMYGDKKDPVQEAVPMCTIRFFPNQIEHCLE